MSELNDIDVAIESALPIDEAESEESEEREGSEEEGEEQDNSEKEEKEGESEEGEGSEDTDEKEGDDGDEKKEDNEPEKPKKPKRNRYQERIDQKTRENYELRAKLAQLEEERENKPPELPKEPDPSKYTYHEGNEEEEREALAKYNQDRGKWEAEVERIKKDHANRGVIRIQNEKRQYLNKVASEKSIYGDFNTAFRNFGSIQITPEMHNAFVHDENKTDLFCFLGNNPKIAEEVSQLKGYHQVKKLSEISIKLQTAKSRKQAKKSKAPPPVGKPKGGTGGGIVKKLDEASFEEVSKALIEAEQKQKKKWL